MSKFDHLEAGDVIYSARNGKRWTVDSFNQIVPGVVDVVLVDDDGNFFKRPMRQVVKNFRSRPPRKTQRERR